MCSIYAWMNDASKYDVNHMCEGKNLDWSIITENRYILLTLWKHLATQLTQNNCPYKRNEATASM